MNQDIKKFEELLKTDTAFQEKISAAIQNFTGDLTDMKAVFEDAILPVAKEAGLSATFEEYRSYIEQNQVPSKEMTLNKDDLAQVAGGAKGFGAQLCTGTGIGIGGSSDAGTCLVIGLGLPAACAGPGAYMKDPNEDDN